MTNSEVAKRICEDIKYVCKTFGNRNAASEGERRTAEYFAAELEACADEVRTETFKVNPSAFKGWIKASVTCALLALVTYFFSSLVCILLLAVSVLPVIIEYMLYKRALDPLFKEENSCNVTALKKCKGEAKRNIYFVANVDAAYENGVKYRLGGVMMETILALDFIGALYFLASAIARWVLVGGLGASIAESEMLYAGLAGLVFVLPLFASYFMDTKTTVVDGANANLTGCFVALNTLRALKDVELEDTNVGVILTGSGACGLRGAKAWCDAHGNEIDAKNTVFIALSTLRELAHLNVNSSEMNLSVRLDADAIKLVLDSAKKTDIKCTNRPIPFDAMDSAVFSQYGFKSAGIIAVNDKLPDYYNTRYDSYDNLSEECIAKCLGLVTEIVEEFCNKV